MARSIHRSVHLSDRDQAIVRTIVQLRQITSTQLLRLYFADGSEVSRKPRMCRVMARLNDWGVVRRIPRFKGGGSGGSGPYVYMPPTGRARVADAHTLDIAELYVSLVEAERHGKVEILHFDPEPYSHVQAGRLDLRPDVYARIRTAEGVRHYFLEVDRATEWQNQIGSKLRRYTSAYLDWHDETFPLVVWIVPDEQRRRFMEAVIRRQRFPQLFMVCTAEETTEKLTAEIASSFNSVDVS